MKKIILFVLVLFLANFVCAVNIDNVNSIELEPGKSGTISFDVENDHDFDVKELSITLDFSGEIPIAPYHSSAGVFIGELDEGDDDSLSFGVITSASAESGLYKIPVLIYYEDNDGKSYEKTDFVSILIKSKPDIGVIMEEPNYLVGDKNDISIKIINRGLSGVKFLRVKVLDSDNYEVISSDEVYIGDIDSDDFDSAEFSLRLNYPLQSKIKIPIKIIYYDSNNNFFQENFDLNTRVYGVDEAKKLGLIENKNYGIIIFIVVAVIALFIIYKVIRRRKKR